MADSENVDTTQHDTTQHDTTQHDTTQHDTTQHDKTQQVTSKTPATKQKNPKRVAAGKAVAERTRIAREAQKKAFIEAQMKKAYPPPVSDTPSADPPPVDEPTKNVLTTTQCLSVISIVVSLAEIYYKREEIKGLFANAPPNSPVVPKPTNASPVDFAPKRGIKPMD